MGILFSFFRSRRQPREHPFGPFSRHHNEPFPQEDTDLTDSETIICSQVTCVSLRSFTWPRRKNRDKGRVHVEWLYRPAASPEGQDRPPEGHLSFITGSGTQAARLCLPLPLAALPEEQPLPPRFLEHSIEIPSLSSGLQRSSSISRISPSQHSSLSDPSLPAADL